MAEPNMKDEYPPHPELTGQWDGVWVQSDQAADGVYVCTLHIGQDDAMVIDMDRAMAYLRHVLWVAEVACYDAALVAQLMEITGDENAVGATITELRMEREFPDKDATGALSYVPIVSEKDRAPLVALFYKGVRIGSFTIKDSYRHALAVVTCVMSARLDNQYHAYLVREVGIDRDKAHNVIASLGVHRLGEVGNHGDD